MYNHFHTSAETISIRAEWLRPSGRAPAELIRDTPVADLSALGANITRRVAYRPLIAVSPVLLALLVSYCT